jgi:aspartokinase
MSLRDRLRSQGYSDEDIDARLERGRLLIARSEAEADQADREAARTVKLTLNQAYLLAQAAKREYGYQVSYGETAATKLRAAFRRMEKRGLVQEIGTPESLTGTCYVVTRLGRYAVEEQGLGS